jgi:acetyl esterase/lipase
MADLPRTTVFIGTRDILLAETHRFRDLATAAGVEVEFHEATGDVHAYPLWPTAEAKRARHRIVETLASVRADWPGVAAEGHESRPLPQKPGGLGATRNCS